MQTKRIEALDLARLWAIIGMVIVNFKLEVLANSGSELLVHLTTLLEGKSGALFVMIAGIGISLMSKSGELTIKKTILRKKGIFLLIFGFLNCYLYNGDILHVYGVFLLVASFFLRINNYWVVFLAVISTLLYVPIFTSFDYDTSWNWETLEYYDFFTVKGYLRNLFFNGFYPVIPWLTFIFLGMWIGAKDLRKKEFHHFLIISGTTLIIIAEVSSKICLKYLLDFEYEGDKSISDLLGTDPMAPLPFYMITGTGFSFLSLGVFFKLETYPKVKKLLGPFAPAGRQALTLYVAHIILVILPLQHIKFLDHDYIETSLLLSFSFLIFSVLYSYFWEKKFKHGPLEIFMRKFTG